MLPRWRGAAPIIHTIMTGDKTTGISFIELSPKKYVNLTAGCLPGCIAPSDQILKFRHYGRKRVTKS